MTTELVHYDSARRALAEAKRVDEVAEIRNQAEAMRAYARQAQNRDLEIDAAEIRFRAERRLGEIMRLQASTVGLNEGGRPPKTGSRADPVSKPTLREAGITKSLADRARNLASIKTDEFEGIVADWRHRTRAQQNRVAVTILREREARAQADAPRADGCLVEDLVALAASGYRAATMYADPPWSFEVYSGKGKGRSAERHYAGGCMSLDDIAALPIANLAADDSALLMWAVKPEIPGALRVIDAWGYTFKTVAFTWVKQTRGGEGLFTGMGYWTRANTELCLLATRGSPQRLDMGVHEVVLSPVREHSRKPDEVRTRIERLVAGPYLELFARKVVPNWTCWGDEIPRADFLAGGNEVEAPVVEEPSVEPASTRKPVSKEPYDIGDIPAFLRRTSAAPA